MRTSGRRRNPARLGLLSAPLLLGLTLGAPEAAAQRTDRLPSPAPQPTVAVPRMTPVGPQRPDAPNPLVLLKPLPAPPPALSAPVVPGQPPAAAKPATAAPGPAAPSAPQPAPQPATRQPVVDPLPAPPPPPERKPERAAEPPPPAAVAARPEPPVQSAAAAPPRVTSRRIVRVIEDVSLRAAPSRSGRWIDDLEPGVRLEVMGPAPDGWVHVGRNGRSLGYLYERYVAEEPAGRNGGQAAPQLAKQAAPQTAKQSGSGPAPGTYAKASREDTGCALPDDFTPPQRRKPIPVGSSVRVLADANLRVAPACDAKVKDVLETDETVTVLGVSGSWYRVGRGGRVLGYVGASLLEERAKR